MNDVMHHGPRRGALALALAVAAWAAPSPAFSGTEGLYSVASDFARGRALNVSPYFDDQLRLDKASKPYPFVWVAIGERGTVVKIDAITGAILGEYRSAPAGRAGNPYNATVEKFGGAWAANRAESAIVPGRGPMGSVVHIGLRENGQCPDRNGNGIVDTSTGLGDIRAWPNAAGADDQGGVSTAADECILHYVRVHANPASHISITQDNDAWVGGATNRAFDLVDGASGALLRSEDGSACGGLTGAIDEERTLWSSSPLLRWSTEAAPSTPVDCYPYDAHGLARDDLGVIWVAASREGVVRRVRSDGLVLGSHPHGAATAAGVASGPSGHVWVAHGASANTIGHLTSDGSLLGKLTVPAGPTGISVDHAGKAWVIAYQAEVLARINPAAGPALPGGLRLGAVDLTTQRLPENPDGLSDMTGGLLLGAPPRGTWTVVHDAGMFGHRWAPLSWIAEPTGDSRITVNVASSDDAAAFGASQIATNGVPPPVAPGRYLRIEVVFERGTPAQTEEGASPALHEVRIGRVPTTLVARPLVLRAGQPPDLAVGFPGVEATLRQVGSGSAVVGARVEFYAGEALICFAVTDAGGVARCSDLIRGSAALVQRSYQARFAGNDTHLPSSGDGVFARVGNKDIE